MTMGKSGWFPVFWCSLFYPLIWGSLGITDSPQPDAAHRSPHGWHRDIGARCANWGEDGRGITVTLARKSPTSGGVDHIRRFLECQETTLSPVKVFKVRFKGRSWKSQSIEVWESKSMSGPWFCQIFCSDDFNRVFTEFVFFVQIPTWKTMKNLQGGLLPQWEIRCWEVKRPLRSTLPTCPGSPSGLMHHTPPCSMVFECFQVLCVNGLTKKGTSTGNHRFSHEIWDFPVIFPTKTNQLSLRLAPFNDENWPNSRMPWCPSFASEKPHIEQRVDGEMGKIMLFHGKCMGNMVMYGNYIWKCTIQYLQYPIPSGNLTLLLKMAIYSLSTQQKWWCSMVLCENLPKGHPCTIRELNISWDDCGSGPKYHW